MNTLESANASLFGSIILGIISWFTPAEIDLGLKIITGIAAIAGAIFSIRYYIAGKKAKDADRKLKEEQLRRLTDE